MKALMLCLLAMVTLLAATADVQAQIMNQQTRAARRGSQPPATANNLPRCTHARKMSGAPCYGG